MCARQPALSVGHSVNINTQNLTPILIRFLIYFYPELKNNKLQQVFYSVDMFSVHFILPTGVISRLTAVRVSDLCCLHFTVNEANGEHAVNFILYLIIP